MKKIYFWAPYNSKIGTVNSVVNSLKSIKNYSKNLYKPYLIDVTGEWKEYEDKFDVIYLRKNKFDIRKLKNKGFFWSRLFFLLIFFLNFRKLKKLLDDHMPEYLIVHLVTSLPLFIFLIFNFKTKLILRISGEPNLGILRKLFWKLLSRKIFVVTCPNYKIKEKLLYENIFRANQIKILLDPIIDIKTLSTIKYKNKKNNLTQQKYFLSVGRLTKQKNFSFLIKAFSNFREIYPDINLFIIGEGEERRRLMNLIVEFNLEKRVFLIGFKNNVYDYMQNAKCLILCSLYENPGHVLIEAAANNCPIISSDCPSGPSEFLDNGKGGLLFKTNNKEDFVKTINEFMTQQETEINKKKYYAKKNSLNYTLYRHYKHLISIID